ncbi:FMN-binding negative transcriptional regulator [Aestuariibacter sp. AA17]|uniref:FMN-binding negative transcriptional regulator n=1 Tax=Fluctibacter corallii TaxID=2984329 RepID=A0ABT3A9W3_9ALTE|nr:FMN-binding negative transcriptional regulator [Aestuariibacter sp. AA17]MCV2885106.1 FMN-binding negative transcriptional regulator [Aestuariibacter sp. AA17]
MYTPKKLALTESQSWDFVEAFPFAQMISADPLQCTHIPMILHRRDSVAVLHTHMAKANPHHRELDGKEVLVIFAGPHTYISGQWYESKPAVPTWNYAAVHVYAKVEVLPPSFNKAFSREILAAYEPHFTAQEDIYDEAYMDKLDTAIVSMKLHVTSVEGKFKLGQHKHVNDQKAIYQTLSNSERLDDLQLAALMREWNIGTGEA